MTMMYRIKVVSQYGIATYTYHKEDNICGLAKYLNKRAKDFPKDFIQEVEIAEDYNVFADGVLVNFLPTEYNNQRFIETYEERLIATRDYANEIQYTV
jgi:hypothetical protein